MPVQVGEVGEMGEKDDAIQKPDNESPTLDPQKLSVRGHNL
jgi:hypothetical protein